MDKGHQGQKISAIIAKCWADERFKQNLLTDTRTTLTAEGVALPDGLEVRVLENTATVVHWILPRKPGDLSDEDLNGISAGVKTIIYGPMPGDGAWRKASQDLYAARKPIWVDVDYSTIVKPSTPNL